MNRGVQERFREDVGVKLPSVTRLSDVFDDMIIKPFNDFLKFNLT